MNILDLLLPFVYLEPLGTFCIPWTYEYLLNTLDLYVLLDTLDLLVPFKYLEPLGALWIPWIFRYLLNITLRL